MKHLLARQAQAEPSCTVTRERRGGNLLQDWGLAGQTARLRAQLAPEATVELDTIEQLSLSQNI